MASQETGAGAGAAQPGDDKDGRSGPMALNPGVPIRGIKMKFAVLAGLVEVGEVSNRDIVETVLNLVSWLRPLRIGLSDGSTVTACYRRWHSDSGNVCFKSVVTPHLHPKACVILFKSLQAESEARSNSYGFIATLKPFGNGCLRELFCFVAFLQVKWKSYLNLVYLWQIAETLNMF